MSPEELKKGMELSTEIRNLATKTAEFVKEDGGDLPSLLVFMAAGEMFERIQDSMMESIRKDIK